MSDVTPRPLRPSERLRACAAMGGTVTLDQSMICQLLAEVADLEKARVVPDALRASVVAEAMAEAAKILEHGSPAIEAGLAEARALKAAAAEHLRRARRLGWIATAMIVLTYGGILWRVL